MLSIKSAYKNSSKGKTILPLSSLFAGLSINKSSRFSISHKRTGTQTPVFASKTALAVCCFHQHLALKLIYKSATARLIGDKGTF